jgi:hypothetical protein
MTKSPTVLARAALETARRALGPYSSRHSRHDFTQAQLFAILVLKTFFQTDYRGIVELLREFAELRAVLELRKVPHWTTLQKAQDRLVKKGLLTYSSEPCSAEPESFISWTTPPGPSSMRRASKPAM